MNRNLLFLYACAAGALTACSGSGSGDISTPGPGPGPAPVGLLSPVTDTSAFEQSIKDGLVQMASAEVLANSGAGSDVSFTGTYTQEADVDESDPVRYDGEYLFVAPRRYINCCWAFDNLQFAPGDPPPVPDSAIRILASDPANGTADAVGEITLAGGTSVQGMYVDDGKLFALTAETIYGSYGHLWGDLALWAPEQHGFSIYDLSDTTNPVLDFEAVIDGVFVDSRRVGDTVYIVSRYTPMVEGLHYYVSTAEQQAENEALLAEIPLDELLPTISVAGVTRPLVEPENCFVTTGDDAGNAVLTTVTAVPVDDPENFESICYSEDAYGVYVSTEALYIAELRPDTALQRDDTRVHKFGLANSRIEYRGSADLVGTVWQGSQPDFRLSEYDGDLRVVTSEFSWDRDDFVDHRLYVLRESNAGLDLDIVSTLPNERRPAEIGKPNEALFAVRFLADRAYAVTFEQIDPLYVIDLADPADPRVAGELEVPGFSDFLHPVSNALLLGLGRDAAGSLKLELFDTADITRPQSRGTLIFGGPGSYSEAMYDRHAFTYQADVAGTDRLAVPANVYAFDQGQAFLGSQLFLFEVRDKATPSLATLNLVGSVEIPAGDSGHEWVDRSRSFLHGDTVFYVRDEAVWASFWHTPSLVNGPF